MKFIQNVNKKCPVCGTIHNFQKLLENNSFGMRDLDTRPPGMMRSMMHLMVEKCPNCGYSTYDMNKPLENFNKSEIESEEYQTILNDDTLSFSLKKFILASMLLEKRSERLAGISYLRAAWMADDCKNLSIARKMRSKAIKFLELSTKNDKDENILLIIVDLYRRVGMFDEASEYAKDLLNNFGMAKYKQNILLYQIKLCLEEDTLDHTIPGNHDFTAVYEDEDDEEE